MDTQEWFRVVAAALGSGLVVKFLDILYAELRRRSEKSEKAKRFVDEHLDPLLKAADELVGKIVSLAGEDFKSLRGVTRTPTASTTTTSSGWFSCWQSSGPT